nr:MAG TPA: hypothetical protein [Caudoviricetes sp.]
MEIGPNDEAWYAMRVTYGRELKIQAAMNGKFETFIPKCYKTVERFGKRHYELTSCISNLLFVYGTKNQIEEERQKQAEIKNDKKWHLLNFIMNHENKMITVPNKQMEDFIRVSNLPAEELIPLDIREGESLTGQRVKVIDGPLVGIEGFIKRIEGNKRVVVTIDGMLATALKFISPSLLTKI